MPLMGSDSVFLAVGSTGRPNYLMLYFFRVHVRIVLLEGENYQHYDSWGPCRSIRVISTTCLPRYDIRWLIGGELRGVAAKIDEFMSIAVFHGGRCQISLVAKSNIQK